jgi:hypothetical protein
MGKASHFLASNYYTIANNNIIIIIIIIFVSFDKQEMWTIPWILQRTLSWKQLRHYRRGENDVAKG